MTSQPHNCPFCHKQYATNAKLLQHQRKEHQSDHNYNQKRGQLEVAAVAAPLAAAPAIEAGQGSGLLVTVSGRDTHIKSN